MINGFMLSRNIVLALSTLLMFPVYPFPHNLLCLLPKSHIPWDTLTVPSARQPQPSALMMASQLSSVCTTGVTSLVGRELDFKSRSESQGHILCS